MNAGKKTPKTNGTKATKKKSTEQELISQAVTWLEKLRDAQIEAVDAKGKEMLTNIEAYVHDSQYFIGKEDYVRAFEAVIWSWAWLEIGKNLGHLKQIDGNGNYGD